MAILLNGPAFEGHITNGELLFILPMLLAILLSIRIIRQLTQQPSQQDSSLLLPAVGVGVLISIATHIKVPAVFDAASIFLDHDK
jgi:predicted acyltransferase